MNEQEERELPIIYLRGYAGDQKGVEATVDDPFYGFNSGSTHVRTGDKGESEFFAFESPVVRLMTDHHYEDVYRRGRQPTALGPGDTVQLPKRSIWIHRYYDVTSKTFDHPESVAAVPKRLEIEDVARGLKDSITLVRERTGADRVILIAHSMGGLVARCLIQKIYPETEPNEQMPATKYIDKVFTYGTPHGGIHFDVLGGDVLEMTRDWFGRNNMDDFGPRRMSEYLSPSGKLGTFDPASLAGAFPPERFFCLVGTNARDYDAAFGLSARLVGEQSDGLVQIKNAYVKGSPRAYVHRSHSGRYGLVNSEEGYQNLRRFLFGDMRVELFLDHLDKLHDHPVESGVSHQAEARVAIRGLPVLMHDQVTEHHSPILLELEKQRVGEPIPLFAVFLIAGEAPDERTCQYALRLGVYRQRRRRGHLILNGHLEQIPLWEDQLVVDLREDEPRHYSGSWAWRSTQANPDDDPERQLSWITLDGVMEARLPLPPRAQELMGPHAELLMKASSWS